VSLPAAAFGLSLGLSIGAVAFAYDSTDAVPLPPGVDKLLTDDGEYILAEFDIPGPDNILIET
jgi:hypothetical protein